MAWSEVEVSPKVMVGQESARNMIARRIIDAWRGQGERVPGLLKSYVI